MNFAETITALGQALLGFTYYYPLALTHLWIMGALFFWFRWERKGRPLDDPPPLPSTPGVTLIVPCHDEEGLVEETVRNLARHKYPLFEIVAVDDGSRDSTGEILDRLAGEIPNLRVLHFEENQGKAMGLCRAALASRYEYLVCIDGDALLDPYAARWMVRHFLESPRVGAVTGNPRIRNRTSLLGKVQVGEYSAIVGLTKRAQRVYGRIFTVSGVVSAFRKSALQDVGLWSLDMVTEDIDISWKLQLENWEIRYEPNAVCWIRMPETLKGLWKQRLRWAQGGSEVLLRRFRRVLKWRSRRMWPILLESVFSILWSYSLAGTILLFLAGSVFPLPPHLQVQAFLPSWPGAMLGLTCMVQFGVSFTIESRYEHGIGKYFYWMIWYPLAFWLINLLTITVGFPKALFKKKGTRAIWTSPDRGWT